MEDSRIIQLYNARDERAIAETSDKYGDYCYRIAYNILTDKLDCEECLDDTWMRAWNTIPPACPQSLGCYLSKIVRNLSLDRYKSKTREKRGGGRYGAALDEIEEFTADTVSVEDEVIRAQLVSSINRFLRQLPERECDMFLRRYYFADSISDIAERFILAESNVYVILSRVRGKLKTHLEKEGYTV